MLPLNCWEAILIDDGSPDGCPQICDEYAAKDSRFSVIHQKNAGVAAARNAGIDIAQGKWIWFVDSDDVVDMRPVGDMVEWLQRHQEVDLLMFDLETFEDGESVASHGFSFSVCNEQLTRNDFFNKYISYFHQQFWFLQSSQFRFTNGIRVSEDLELMYKYCMLCQHPVKADAMLYYYRVRETSVTQDKDYRQKAVTDLRIVLNNLAEWVRRYEIKPEPWLDFRLMKLFQNLLFSASHIPHLDKERFQKKVRFLISTYKERGFPFVRIFKNRLALWDVRWYFLMNRIYLKFKDKR